MRRPREFGLGSETRCRATLFDEEVRFSENIDFQYPMKVRWGVRLRGLVQQGQSSAAPTIPLTERGLVQKG